MDRNQRTVQRTLLAIGLGVSLVGGVGCVSYSNISGPESPPSFRSPNHYASVDVSGSALDWVITRHGPKDSSGYVVNLPYGTTQDNAMEIFSKLPEGAVWPTSTDADPTGMFHISRVWIRASEAKVDIVYPFEKLDGTRGSRGVTVWLQGGVRDWRVIRGQYWAPGTVSVPPVSVPWESDDQIEAQRGDDPETMNEQGLDEGSMEPVDEVSGDPADAPAAAENEIPEQQTQPPVNDADAGMYKEVPVGDG